MTAKKIKKEANRIIRKANWSIRFNKMNKYIKALGLILAGAALMIISCSKQILWIIVIFTILHFLNKWW